jgi:hypothetical protein
MPRKKINTPTPLPEQESSAIPVIGKNNQEKVLSKNEADFNRKIKKIETLKKDLIDIKNKLENAKQRVAKELFPLMSIVKEKQKKYIHLLDVAYDSGFFKKRDAETLMEHIMELCEHVLSHLEMVDEKKMSEDEAIEKIKEKYENLLYSEEEKEMLDQATKDVMKNMFGVDIDLDKLKKNPHEYFEKKQIELEEEQERRFEQTRAKQATRKKTTKQMEKEKKEEEAKKALSKDIRSIYTSLAKELHPDLEQNEEERERKTEMMKRVTAAYETNDLFELLKLQLEYQIQHERINSLLEEQIKRYNQVLQQQINELENEKLSIIGFGSPMSMIYHKYCAGTPQIIERSFRQEKNELNHVIDSLQDSINTHTDYKVLKEFLKEVRKEYKERERGFDLGSIMNGW